MRFCAKCGQRATPGKKFCTQCGTPLPDAAAVPRDSGTRAPGPVPPTARAWPALSPVPPPAAGRTRRRAAAGGIATALLLSGLGVWFLLPRGAALHAVARQSTAQSTATSATADSAAAGEGSTPSDPGRQAAPPSAESQPPGPAPPVVGAVTIAPAAAGNASAPGIAALVDDYFSSINNHDYQAYTALRSPQAQTISQSQFVNGYGSTTDDGETLRTISSADNGDVVAGVTFTSHQDPSQSANNNACTAWTISLYLVPDNGSYLIDNPPSGYHAKDSACR